MGGQVRHLAHISMCDRPGCDCGGHIELEGGSVLDVRWFRARRRALLAPASPIAQEHGLTQSEVAMILYVLDEEAKARVKARAARMGRRMKDFMLSLFVGFVVFGWPVGYIMQSVWALYGVGIAAGLVIYFVRDKKAAAK